MKKTISIALHPLGKTLQVEAGTPLRDRLFDFGVEFPCGGGGRCRGCRVRILQGESPASSEDQHAFSAQELAQGWRLACRMTAEQNLTLELAQWECTILSDDSVFAFTPQDGFGIAVDLGTTTLVAQLVDRSNGHVLGVRTRLNPQASHGADLMTRIHYAVAEKGQPRLTQLIRQAIGEMIAELLAEVDAPSASLRRIILVGNTAMHHLFGGIDVRPLSEYPFEPIHSGLQEFHPANLNWELHPETRIQFLPCLGGFVGSDLLAGIMATRLHESESPLTLIDLGTNGEIIVGRRGRIFCASTAAGPAFEGGRIGMGMRAATGAINEVRIENHELRCHVIGHGRSCGLCGSGLVDAAAAALELKKLQTSGRFTNGSTLPLLEPVTLSQKDIRELQLAKGAIAAGLRILLERMAITPDDIQRLYLAGAFGNTINSASALRIGLFHCPSERVSPAGNTALLGAKMALFLEDGGGLYQSIRDQCEHVMLSGDPHFQEIFVDEMFFPNTD